MTSSTDSNNDKIPRVLVTTFKFDGQSLSRMFFSSLTDYQHEVNDQFFNLTWNLLKNGGVYIAPNGSVPMMIKDVENRQWIIHIPDVDHPAVNFWKEKFGLMENIDGQ